MIFDSIGTRKSYFEQFNFKDIHIAVLHALPESFDLERLIYQEIFIIGGYYRSD